MAKVMIDGVEFTVRELFLDCTVKSHGVKLHRIKDGIRPNCTYHIIRYADGHYYYRLEMPGKNFEWKRIRVIRVRFMLEQAVKCKWMIAF